MKKILLVIFINLLFIINLIAQESQIKGFVIDSISDVKLANTSISLLRQKDSILVSFTRAKTDGSFTFNNIKNGNYFLLFSYPAYADYVEPFTIDKENPTKDFKQKNLLLKARLLQEVIFKGEAVAIRVKGDTTEFNAGSFKVQPNAKVEDLLKQLPGIQIDKDGKITAQGQTISRVLVDGEEFFGDDPTLVTKNLRSDMVDKVQLYDDKSENAKFTGIDDGVLNKTINLKLKEDKKKGFFGKLDAGIGNDDFYTTQGMFNVFNNKQKLSLYSTIGNTQRTGLDWESSRKFGVSNSNIEIGDDGSVSVFFNGGDQFSSESFNGQGIPEIINTGIHYENKWKDKHGLNLDFKVGRLGNLGFNNSINQNSLPNSILTNNSNRNFDNLLNQNKLNAAYEFKIDTNNTVKIAFDNTNKISDNRYTTLTSGFTNAGDRILNNGEQNFNQESEDHRLNTSVFYGKKFKKVGRSLTFRFNQSYFDNNAEGFLKSTNNFFNNTGALDSTNVIDQLKQNQQYGESYKTSLTFTEKLSKTLALSTNYDFAINDVTSRLNSFNTNQAGEYVILDSLFSNDLIYKSTTHQGGLSLSYKKDKRSITLGAKVANSKLNQNNLISNFEFNRNFINFLPNAIFEYKFSKQSSFRFSYDGSTRQPTVNQLQPILNNNDPLNLILGNPDLDIAFNNRISANFNSYKVLSGRSIWAYASYSFTNNDIVSDVSTDEAGKRILRYTNLEDKRPSNFYLSADYGAKIASTKIYWRVSAGGNGNTFYNLVTEGNNVKKTNKNESYNLNTSFSLSTYEDKSIAS